MEREHRKQSTRLARANGNRTPLDAGLHGSQESDVHCASLDRPHVGTSGQFNHDLPALMPPLYRAAKG